MIHNVTSDRSMISWCNGEDKICVRSEAEINAFCMLDTNEHIAAATEQRVYIYTADGAVCNIIEKPDEFPDTVSIYDVFYEESNFTVILTGYGGYDIACHFEPLTGELLDWHYTK